MMETNQSKNVLLENSAALAERFTDDLFSGTARADEGIAAMSAFSLDSSLVKLNEELTETLLPVEPSSSFVENLRQRLIHRQASTLVYETTSPETRGQWVNMILSMFTIIGIASRVIGGVVLLTALLLKRRRQTSPA